MKSNIEKNKRTKSLFSQLNIYLAIMLSLVIKACGGKSLNSEGRNVNAAIKSTEKGLKNKNYKGYNSNNINKEDSYSSSDNGSTKKAEDQRQKINNDKKLSSNEIIAKIKANKPQSIITPIDPGFDVNKLVKDKTLLMNAAINGRADIVKELLKIPNIDVNIKDIHGNTALMCVVKNNHTLAQAKLFLDEGIPVRGISVRGTPVNTKDDYWSKEALIDAARSYSPSRALVILTLLLNASADFNIPDNDGNTALIIAAINGHADIVIKLLETSKIDVNIRDNNGKTLLMHAAINGHTDLVTKLLKVSKIAVNTKDSEDRTALMYAAINGHYHAAKILVDQGADMNIQDNNKKTALIYAAENRSYAVAQILVAKGADVNIPDNNGKTALIYGDLGIIKELLKAPRVDVNIPDNDGNTALIVAAINGHADIVIKLLETSKIDVNIPDNNGKTLLMHAAINGHADLATKLLKVCKIDVNIQDIKDRTALIYAAINGHYQVAQILVAKGADVNIQDNNGKTALIYGNKGIIKELLKAPKININIPDHDGNTALSLADASKNKETIKILKAFAEAKSLHNASLETSTGSYVEPVGDEALGSPDP